jgi:flagellar secretion chaperone FliS
MSIAQHTANVQRARHFVGTYHQVGVQTTVSGASSHQLIALLFDGFFAAVARTRGAMRSGDVQAKGMAISQAVRIVDEGLKAGLNLTAGGKLAVDLADLYAYVCLRLTQANLRNDEKCLDECVGLMTPLRDAWTAIGSSAVAQAHF